MRRIHYLALCLCAALVGPARGENAARTVQFVTDAEREGGSLVAISTAAFERVGYTVEIRYLPWARALYMAMNGEAEGLLGTYYSDARAKEMAYSDKIGSTELLFFKLKSTSISYATLDDLRPYRIGTVLGAIYTPEFDHADYLHKEAVANYDVNLRKLMLGRITLFLEKKLQVQHALATRYPQLADKIDTLDRPLFKTSFYNAFSRRCPGHDQKLADFNRGLAMLAKDGGLQAILDKHMHD